MTALEWFAWGVAAGYTVGLIQDVWKTWRAAKKHVNEVRAQYGRPLEHRWWKL